MHHGSDAIKILIESYFLHKSTVRFDYRDIRKKGSLLVTSGGKAPGPQPLKDCIHNITKILDRAIEVRGVGSKLTTLEVHDVLCFIANAVLAGGIRRAALISLFSFNDNEMMACKSGAWWEKNPQRGRANNSVVLVRHKIHKKDFMDIWKIVEASKSGEPGVFFTNDKELLCNPCCLTGDNKLLTDNGYVDISNLSGKDNIKLQNKFGEIVDGIVWKTGTKEVLEIKAGNKNDPVIFKATPDHIFEEVDGNEIEAKDLYNKRLSPFYKLKTIDNDNVYMRYGFILGDGTFRYNSDKSKNVQCSFTPIKDDEVKSLFDKTGWSDNESNYTVNISYDELEQYGINTSLSTYDRELPSKLDNDFLTGLYSANGCIINNKRVSYKTTSYKLRDKLIEELSSLGINSYYTTNKPKLIKWNNGEYMPKESYDINISSFRSIVKFAEKISFIQTYKQEALMNVIREKAPFVYSIKSIGKQDVYDFSLFDDTHWGVVNGMIVHNCEISLKSMGFCNLTTVNVNDCTTQEELNNRVKAASFIGTLQASYTDFHYLRDAWKVNAEKEALLGVSMTGIGSGSVLKLNLEEAATVAVEENKRVAALIGINSASRVTCIKPEGSASLVAGTSSGIHSWHAPYYIRRMRLGKDEAIYQYLNSVIPELIEDEFFNPDTQAVLSIPVKAPKGAIYRTESPIDLLSRVKRFHDEWIKPGHIKGSNTNNVSVTVSIKENEWKDVGDWMWTNFNSYNGISVIPYDGGNYIQAPFEEIDVTKYNEMLSYIHDIDLTQVIEELDNTNHGGELACSGGACTVESL